MLRTLFFVLSFLTDYRAVCDAMQTCMVLGVVNARLFVSAMIGVSILRGVGVERVAPTREARPEGPANDQTTRLPSQRATALRPACTRSPERASSHHWAS